MQVETLKTHEQSGNSGGSGGEARTRKGQEKGTNEGRENERYVSELVKLENRIGATRHARGFSLSCSRTSQASSRASTRPD